MLDDGFLAVYEGGADLSVNLMFLIENVLVPFWHNMGQFGRSDHVLGVTQILAGSGPLWHCICFLHYITPLSQKKSALQIAREVVFQVPGTY